MCHFLVICKGFWSLLLRRWWRSYTLTLRGCAITPYFFTYKNDNKRPKGPHIMHLSTMCHLFDEFTRTAIFVYWLARKTQSWKRTLGSCFLSRYIEFHSVVSEEKLKMSQPIRGRGGHLAFFDRPEKHKIGRGHWDLATCQASLNSVQRFLKRSQKMFQPIRGWGVHEFLSVVSWEVKNTLCWEHVINSM